MLRGLFATSIGFRYLIAATAVAVLVFGSFRISTMPVDVLPEFSPPYVEIQTEALGLSAAEVEQLITVPMEQDLLAGVAWLDSIHSKSVTGLSSTFLLFEPGTDMIRARQMVTERLIQAHALPHVSKPPTMLQPLSSSSRFAIVGLSSKSLTPIEISILAKWTIGPRIMGVPGVANVSIWGLRDRQLQVLVDPERLRAHNVSLLQVIETTGNALWVSSLSFLEASTPGTGGFIDTPQQRLGIWHVLPISSPADLGEVPVEESKYQLKDVATVVQDHQPLIGDALANDSPSLLLVVEKLPGVSTIDVTRRVDAALQAMRPGLAGVEINSALFRPMAYIELALANLGLSLLIGAVLVTAVILLFLFDLRLAFVSLASIVVSMTAALLVLYWRSATLNMVVLLGLAAALTVLIDDAVRDADAISRRMRQPRRLGVDHSIGSTVIESLIEHRGGLLLATFTLFFVVMPVAFVNGSLGNFIQPLILSYALAVLASILVALTITPALGAIMLAKLPAERRDTGLSLWMHNVYERILGAVLRRPRALSGVVVPLVLACVTFVPVVQRPGGFLPTFKETDLLVMLDGAPGTSHPAMVRAMNKVVRELKGIAGVRNVGAHVGRAVFGDQVVGVNSSRLWINLDPTGDHDAVVTRIKEMMAGYPGLNYSVQTYLSDKTSGLTTAPAEPIYVRVFGSNLEALKTQAEGVLRAVSNVDGVINPRVNFPVEEATLEIEVDLNAADKYGVKPGDVRRSAATLLSGLQVGSLFEDQKVFDVVVWGVPDVRSSVSAIRELLIDTPSGQHVRLSDVAAVRIGSTPSVIKRNSVSQYIDITFAVTGRDMEAIATDLRNAIQGVTFDLEYHAEVLGSYADTAAMLRRVQLATVMAIVGIVLLLQAAFDNWRMAVVTALCLPLALSGGVLAAYATGLTISLGALAGLLALFGIAVRASVSLVTRCIYLREHERVVFGQGLVALGARDMLKSFVIVLLAIAALFLPVLAFGAIAGHELLMPMAIVMLGGLLSTAIYALLIVPAVYLRFGQRTAVRIAEEPVFGQGLQPTD